MGAQVADPFLQVQRHQPQESWKNGLNNSLLVIAPDQKVRGLGTDQPLVYFQTESINVKQQTVSQEPAGKTCLGVHVNLMSHAGDFLGQAIKFRFHFIMITLIKRKANTFSERTWENFSSLVALG